jgi:hypothetical protein
LLIKFYQTCQPFSGDFLLVFRGLFPNTAFDPFVQNAAESQVREATNSRAIWSFSNQDAGALWAQWGKAGIREQPPNVDWLFFVRIAKLEEQSP